MRILQVSTMDINGGAEKTAWDLHRTYRALGHDSTLAVGIKRSGDPHTIELGSAWFSRDPVRFLLSGEALGIQGANHPASRKLLERVDVHPDVIHLHNLHGRYFDVAAIAHLAASAPTVLTMHDMWMLTGHCAHPFGCERFRTGCGSCPDLTIYPAARFDFTRRNLARKQRAMDDDRVMITSPGQWLLDLLEGTYLAGHPTQQMPNSVDTAVFTPGDQRTAREALGLPIDVPIVMFPGRLLDHASPFKGQPVFLETVQQLADLGVLGLAFGGETTPEGSTTDGVRILSPTFDERVLADGYRAADVVLVPSRAETSGIVLLEAMACGRPVVATRVGGIPEVVRDGVTGDLVPVDDVDATVAACRRLLDSPDLRARYGAAGREVAASYERTVIADRWLELYAALIDARAASA